MRWKGIPVVMHTHTTAEDMKDSFKFSTKLAPKLKSYLKHFYNQADYLISPSEYTRQVVKGYGVSQGIDEISNGVDSDQIHYDREAGERYRQKYSLHGLTPFSVGHVFKRKGVIEFMDIAKKFPENSFIWFGRVYKDLTDNDLKNAVKDKPENVQFTGYVRDVKAAYNAADIFVFPSWCENQGIAILEAAACKKPLILRNLPTYEGWLVDGKNCLKAETNEEFTKHLGTVLEDGRLRGVLGEKAYEMSKEHDLKKIGLKLIKTYEKVLK